jgi:hypothetical protein
LQDALLDGEDKKRTQQADVWFAQLRNHAVAIQKQQTALFLEEIPVLVELGIPQMWVSGTLSTGSKKSIWGYLTNIWECLEYLFAEELAATKAEKTEKQLAKMSLTSGPKPLSEEGQRGTEDEEASSHQEGELGTEDMEEALKSIPFAQAIFQTMQPSLKSKILKSASAAQKFQGDNEFDIHSWTSHLLQTISHDDVISMSQALFARR